MVGIYSLPGVVDEVVMVVDPWIGVGEFLMGMKFVLAAKQFLEVAVIGSYGIMPG